MSQVIAIDINRNKHFTSKPKIEVVSDYFIGEYYVKQAFFKKMKTELLMLIEKNNDCLWVVVKVKSYYQKIEQYAKDKTETEFIEAFKLLHKGQL